MYYVLCNTASSRARRRRARGQTILGRSTARFPIYVETAIGWKEDEDKSGVTKFGLLHHELK